MRTYTFYVPEEGMWFKTMVDAEKHMKENLPTVEYSIEEHEEGIIWEDKE